MRRLFLLAAAACGLFASSAQAQVTLLDQIGPTSAGQTGQVGFSSQRFEAAFAAQFDCIVGDDFVVPAGPGMTLTSVSAALVGFNGFVNTFFTDGTVQNYQVNIYSPATVAGTNLIGNVASFTTTGLTGVTTTFPWTADTVSGLVSIDVSAANITLAPGTYWIGVNPRMDFATGGQLAVYESTFGGGNNNEFQAQPGNGFGGGVFNSPPPGSTNPNAAYAVFATPVPEPTSMALVGLGAAGFVIRRWRKK